jgi:lipoprotein-releasing system ATP-binding protein
MSDGAELNETAPAVDKLVEAVQLAKIYRTPASEVVVFEGVNLAIPKGRLIAVIGPSGAGKSTLLHLFGGLDEPTRGEVRFKGRNIFKLAGAELARFRNHHVGFVFQFHHLLPEFSAMENAMMPRLIRGERKAATELEAKRILDRVGLSHRLEHKVGELSGGEQQRVAIARALIGKPELLLADEPTGNLDFRSADSIFEMIRELHAERGLTSVIVTHNEKLAVQCDEVWELTGGTLRAEATRQ